MMQITIDARPLTLGELREAWAGEVQLTIGARAREQVEAAEQVVNDVLASGDQVYGVNTGFGQLAQVRISDSELSQLQENLVRSHACGLGALLPDEVTRLIMVLKTATLARGYSGVSPGLIDKFVALVNNGIYPCVPAKGSVGASGDLAPLAHLAGALLGAGDVHVNGQRLAASSALATAGIAVHALAPKEGLALINGTQVSAGLALAALFRAERVLAAALVAGAMSADAVQGSDTPFDPRIQALRGHAGQAAVAATLRRLMQGSEIRDSHIDCSRVQDPYSIRCQPQVVGACLDVMRHVAQVLGTEANAVTDNPLVFAASGDILSGGNFHAEPVAMAADYLALAIAEIGALAERRIALLIDSHLSGLPAFLVEDGGLNSGFMLPQVTAAALASENKSLAHPASVDSIPTSANQEDHVSMATFAANRLHTMLDNTAAIVAIELLAAAQGTDFHAPKKSSPALESAKGLLRELSPAYDSDRGLHAELEAVIQLVLQGRFLPLAEELLPSFAA